MSKRTKAPSMTQAQRVRLHDQLAEISKQINTSQLTRAGSAITTLISKHPRDAQINHVASGYFARTGDFDRAIYYAEQSAKLEPSVAEYHGALGTLMVQADQNSQAIEHLERALKLEPNLPQAMSALGIAYLQTGAITKARNTFEQCISLSPDDHEPIMNLALLESDIANAHRAIELMRQAISKFPDHPILHDSLAMFSCYDDQLSPEEVFAIHQSFGRCVQPKVRPPSTYPNAPDPDKRLRIGFVSPDFKVHSIAYFIEPLFEHLDRDHFELCVYSTSSHTDAMTTRLKSHADLWRACTTGIANTHKQIVNDRLDILVELTGHFASNQLPLMAAKPAPVSITMVGYANTTGLESITARIVDSITDPKSGPESNPKHNADALATEQLVRVPGCFLCYRPPTDAPPINEQIKDPDPARPFTFGSFNDLRKMSPSTLSTWAAILNANPATRLVLKTARLGDQEVHDDILSRFKQLGVDPSRIDLLGRTPTTKDHLNLYNQIDCSLDTFPYTGTTTTCESLWMGVPMITLLGNAHAGRVSASLLTAIGREDLIAQDTQGYIDRATTLAQSGAPSKSTRAALREQLANSPLTDEQSYTHKIETIFRSLWQSWCQSQEQRT